MRHLICTLLLALGLLVPASSHPHHEHSTSTNQIAQSPQEVHDALESSLTKYLHSQPETAFYLGESQQRVFFDNHSLDFTQERLEMMRSESQKLRSLYHPRVDQDKNLLLFADYLDGQASLLEHDLHHMPLNQLEGAHLFFSEISTFGLEKESDLADLHTRLSGFSTRISQDIDCMRAGIHSGRVLPKNIVRKVIEQIDNYLTQEENPYLASLPSKLRNGSQYRNIKTLLENSVTPAYRELKSFLISEYAPHAPDELGLGDQPKGEEAYQAQISRHTSLALSPQEIHEIGLEEVARLSKKMHAIRKQVGFEGSLSEFFSFVRAQPELYFTEKKDVLQAYRSFSKEVDYQLSKLFSYFPRMPYGIMAVDEAIEDTAPGAFYGPFLRDGIWTGKFSINTSRPETRPRFIIPTLTLHEAVPGHHFQIALALEMENQPRFRRFGLIQGDNAYVEGWALYAETLGYEMGFYDDPYNHLGHLSESMWRACRLVVDTGIHTMGWTRQQAIDFMVENTPESPEEMAVEVDRYTVWPGQALSYKLGALKILELRALAENKLGEHFDIREFHNRVLQGGSLPLYQLEENIKSYIHQSS